MVQAAGPREVASDWDLLERARHGDAPAWKELASRHQPRLTALALFVARSPSIAEDVVQETFVRAMRARIPHRAGTVSGYLGTIAYRLAVKEATRERRHLDIASLDFPDVRAGPLETLLTADRARRIAAAIDRLDDEHRHVLVLRFYGGHSYEEIATLLTVPLGTVKSRIFYAVQSCRKRLSREDLLE